MQEVCCRKCGTVLRPNAKFCDACGTIVIQQSAEPAHGVEWYYQQYNPVNMKPKTSRSFSATLKAMLLCLEIFAASLLLVGLFDLRQAFSKGELNEVLEPILSQAQMMQLTTDDPFSDPAEAPVTENALGNALGTDLLPEDMQNVLEGLLGQVDISGISSSEIQQMMGESSGLIADIAGEALGGGDMNDVMGKIGTSGLKSLLDFSKEKVALIVSYTLKLIQSNGVFLILGVLTFLPMIRLAKHNKWNMLQTGTDLGVTLTVEGALMMLSAGCYHFRPNLWKNMFGEAYRLAPLIGTALTKGLILSAAIMVLGVILVLVRICLKRK